ncbi:hypothetical protein LINPERHAP1_LOCUS37775 [Linum perenne]
MIVLLTPDALVLLFRKKKFTASTDPGRKQSSSRFWRRLSPSLLSSDALNHSGQRWGRFKCPIWRMTFSLFGFQTRRITKELRLEDHGKSMITTFQLLAGLPTLMMRSRSKLL